MASQLRWTSKSVDLLQHKEKYVSKTHLVTPVSCSRVLWNSFLQFFAAVLQ